MNKDDIFEFGQYEGFSLREVYQGTNNINIGLLKAYMSYMAKECQNRVLLYELLKRNSPKRLEFEINDTFFKVYPNSSSNDQWIERLENVFFNRALGRGPHDGRSIIDDFNLKIYSKNQKRTEIIVGNPTYIAWCLMNIEHFKVSSSTLNELQLLDVYNFIGIRIIHKIDDIYEFRPKISVGKYRFPDEILLNDFC